MVFALPREPPLCEAGVWAARLSGEDEPGVLWNSVRGTAHSTN